MKKLAVFMLKLLLKVAVLLALALVWGLYYVFVLCCVTVRYLALPVMLVAAVISITTYADDGLTPDVVECILTFVAAAAFYFALPLVPNALNYLLVYLSEVLRTPITTRSSVKYTF